MNHAAWQEPGFEAGWRFDAPSHVTINGLSVKRHVEMLLDDAPFGYFIEIRYLATGVPPRRRP